MNDLIADVPEWQAPGMRDAAGAVPVVGPAFEGLTSAIGDGSWTGGLNGLIGTGSDLMGMATNPLGTLASSVVSFLLDRFRPFQEMLDDIVGNPNEVEAAATTWGNVNDRMGSFRSDLAQAESRSTGYWEGGAGEAFRQNVQARIQDIDEITRGIPGLVTGHIIASGIVTTVRGIIHELCSDLVGKVIGWGAEMLFTFGAAAPAVVARASSTIIEWINTAREFFNTLLDAMGFLGTALRSVDEFMSDISPEFLSLQSPLTGDSIPLGIDMGNIAPLPVGGLDDSLDTADNVSNR